MNQFEKITKKIIDFRDAREWKQFHNPKDLSLSISIEANELLEIFQWNNLDSLDIKNDKEIYQRVEDEIADVMNYVFLLANELEIDLENAMIKKIDKNNDKYPVEKCKSKSTKYNRL